MNTLAERENDPAVPGAYDRMDEAWQWLCERRDAAPEGADVWHIRWQQLTTGSVHLTKLTNQVLRGEYRLSPLQLQGRGENRRAVWGAQDALVLKWVALGLQHRLPLHPACEHVKGHGGGKQSVDKLHHLLTRDENAEKKNTEAGIQARATRKGDRHYKWVCRTDIRGYYRNINKMALLSQVKQHVQSRVLRDLVDQYIHYTVEDGGTFHTPEKGISRGCPLSPLMGALHLYDMDAHFSEQKHIHYVRYMDDVIILAKSRWQLRRHTKRLMQWFNAYGFEAHPDKTQIGRAEKGFDWMGAWLTHEGVTDIAPRAKANHREKVRRLYERLARVPLWRRKRARQQVNARVSTYRKRWYIWAGALLCVAGGACADSPVVVLTSGNHAGDTGARYPIAATVNITAAPRAQDWGGFCISQKSLACAGDGAIRARHTPIGWGVEMEDALGRWSGVILVPKGTIVKSRSGPNEVSSLDLANGHVTYGDGSSGVGCEPVEGDDQHNVAWYAFSKASVCPYNPTITNPRTAGTMVAAGEFAVYADRPLVPGTFAPTNLYVGHHTQKDFFASLPKPSAIIVSGLNCNMQVSSVSGASVSGLGTHDVSLNLGTIAAGGSPSGTAKAAAYLGITTTCTGTNSTDAAAHIVVATAFRAGPGSTADATGFIRESGVPGIYLTINQNRGSCTVSSAVLGPTLGHPYAPGAPGTASSETVVASLCSDGTPVTLGEHKITAVAQLVNR